MGVAVMTLFSSLLRDLCPHLVTTTWRTLVGSTAPMHMWPGSIGPRTTSSFVPMTTKTPVWSVIWYVAETNLYGDGCYGDSFPCRFTVTV